MTTVLVIVLSLMTLSVSSGCKDTPHEKIEGAKEDLKQARKDVKEAVSDALTSYRDEWQAFKFKAEARIRDGEYTMHEYIRKMETAEATPKANFNKTIREFELRSSGLSLRLQEYRDNGKGKWIEFRHALVRDLDSLESGLKELKVNVVQ